MKQHHRLLSLLFIIVALALNCTVISAQIQSLDAVPMEKAEIDAFMEGREFEVTDEPADSRSINSFDISDDGLIALCFNASSQARINIYDQYGQFLYGYRLLNRGANMTVYFEGEQLAINFGKENVVGVFDENGDCTKMVQYPSSLENREVLDAITFQPTDGTIDGKSYSLERDITFQQLSWSRFVLEDSAGNRQIVYDATWAHNFRAILFYLFWIAGGIGVIMGVRKRIHQDSMQACEDA